MERTQVEEGADYEGGQRPAEPAQGRLVREDEHDKSDEEEADDGRVDFTVDLQKKDKQQWRQAFLAAESEGPSPSEKFPCSVVFVL